MAIKFIDLFSGLGGFHQAVTRYGVENEIEVHCLFASEKDKLVAAVYERTYEINSLFDITEQGTHDAIDESILDAGGLDFVFAGFPCQPFSHAGHQNGFDDIESGNLFFQIRDIVERNQPTAILLENVRNLMTHDDSNTWARIRQELEELEYQVDVVVMSPNSIPGDNIIPAIRDRAFIMCYRNDVEVDVNRFFNNEIQAKYDSSIYNENQQLKQEYFIANAEDYEEALLSEEKQQVLLVWQDFKERIEATGHRLISPLWPHYFDANIDISDEPGWKQKIINRNRLFYENNYVVYNEWYFQHQEFLDGLNQSLKKFEWNAGNDIDTVWQGIVQFRPSGVRVKRPNTLPTFVAINQTPILAMQNRFILPEEMARLYGFEGLDFGNQSLSQTYKQLGNTVSVDVVKYLIEHMFDISNLNDLIDEGAEND